MVIACPDEPYCLIGSLEKNISASFKIIIHFFNRKKKYLPATVKDVCSDITAYANCECRNILFRIVVERELVR